MRIANTSQQKKPLRLEDEIRAAYRRRYTARFKSSSPRRSTRRLN